MKLSIIKYMVMFLSGCGLFVCGMECGARLRNAEIYQKTDALIKAAQQPSGIAAQEIQMIVGRKEMRNHNEREEADRVITDDVVQASALSGMRDLADKYEKQRMIAETNLTLLRGRIKRIEELRANGDGAEMAVLDRVDGAHLSTPEPQQLPVTGNGSDDGSD
jgi:hypothetical protein